MTKQYVCEFHGESCPDLSRQEEHNQKHCSKCGKFVNAGEAVLIDLVYDGQDLNQFWLVCNDCLIKLENQSLKDNNKSLN